jgi:hypothetical protein
LVALKQAQSTGQVIGAYDSDSQNQSIASSPVQQFHQNPHEFRHPSAEVMLNALLEENRLLRARLVETERDYIRLTRLNDVYREEIIDLKRKVCLHRTKNAIIANPFLELARVASG